MYICLAISTWKPDSNCDPFQPVSTCDPLQKMRPLQTNAIPSSRQEYLAHKKQPPPRPYSRTLPRALWWS